MTRRRHPARRRAADDPLTRLLGAAAVLTTAGVVLVEVTRVRQRGGALPDTVEVARAAYRTGSLRENALLNLLVTFNASWALARVSTHMIRRRGRFGPFRNATIGRTHVHHFVPGIVLVLLAGGLSIVSRDQGHDPWLAVPFGVGAALTLDESALLLRLDDVYWTEEGVLSVQISLAAVSLVAATALAARALRRGERRVLGA